MATTVQENRPLARTVRKIRCAAMVGGLAQSWQSWANEHSMKQVAVPTGWVPDSIMHDELNIQKASSEVLLPATALVTETGGDGRCKIKTSSVTKMITPKRNNCGNDLVSLIKQKIDSKQMASEAEKPFLRNESPTRRRHCISKASTIGKAWSQMDKEERKMGSRSSSVDTEDSGLGEEVGLSDNSDYKGDHKDVPERKHKSRPKIKVATMADLKNKWRQWSEQHIEGQKLNPFSEEFDYEHAMASRLQKGDEGYGRPKEGSKTAERAQRAQKHIRREMEEMCYIIRDMGAKGKDGKIRITFGRLFDRYVNISDKVVGILLRCRKHGMVAFEGEMLWQGRDDHVIITLLE
ncbi:actin-binding Rho-activating protein [Scleropages formosus]|uniref:Actin-binding Rho-activating protein n=1 Tax=Scleropages formosus TaxID=113540 RepID=A0A8C9RMC7_SCLFO|nr:actin-binding Rho-activating protein-like [Scleropages formosus]